LYEIKENGDEEKALVAAATRKHQIEADRVIGGIGCAAAVTMLRDALLSTALYVCLACAALVLGARYQRRETRENIQTTTSTHADATAETPVTVPLAGVARVVIPESEASVAGSMSVASHDHISTASAPRRSECVTQQPARLQDGFEVYVAPTTPLRNVACERKAVTAELRAIGLRSDDKHTLLNRGLKGTETEDVPTRILSNDWAKV